MQYGPGQTVTHSKTGARKQSRPAGSEYLTPATVSPLRFEEEEEESEEGKVNTAQGLRK